MQDCKYEDDGMIIQAKDFVPLKEYVLNAHRYWIRTFFEIDSEKKLILPLTFLIDSGCPFDMVLS